MKILPTEKGLIKTWAPPDEIEEPAIEQLKNIAAMPFIFKHVAVMPDVHLGKGATVGSVLASKSAIMPAAVGVDIGCGMCAVKTTLDVNQVKDKSKEIWRAIEKVIPVGFESNKEISSNALNWSGWKHFDKLSVKPNVDRIRSQLGTLGGGNHFIEICEEIDTAEPAIWIVLHSGSRNIGKVTADYHIHESKRLMDMFHISLEDPDLAYLPIRSEECGKYLWDLTWCQEFAKQNRLEMMRRIITLLLDRFGEFHLPTFIDCHHNYAACEHHFGENVWVTRKGAVNAQKDKMGIIPGSMGTRSYIVRGLGNPQSFNSCSHGAGRRMSRAEARRTYTAEDLKNQTDGVVCRKDEGIVDEIPGAYKDIDAVIENQKDLVEIVAVLKQFICVKG